MEAWTGDTTKALPLVAPKFYGEKPVQDHPNAQPTGFQMMVQPWSAAKTKQALLYVVASTVEVLAELDTNVFHGTDAKHIYQLYEEAVQKWEAAQAGILAPTMLDMARVRNPDVRNINAPRTK